MDYKKVFLFHFTNINNLNGIMENGIICDNSIDNTSYINSGNQGIKDRRKTIYTPSQHAVADFVPFYFSIYSPMLYTQWINNRVNQEDIIYIVLRLSTIIESGVPFCFSDRNAAKIGAKFYSDVKDLDELDWNSINAKIWKNTDSEPERQEKKMAEFLVLHKVPYQFIRGFATYSDKAKDVVLNTIGHETDKKVVTKREWYY